MTDRFQKTREALAAYHAHDATFDAMVEEIRPMSNVEATPICDAWFDKQKELKIAAGKEFVKVTPNSEDKAFIVGISFMDRISGYNDVVRNPD